MEATSLYSAATASSARCLDGLRSRCDKLPIQLRGLELARIPRKGVDRIGNSIRAGLVDSIVDEIFKISKASGSIIMNGTSRGAPTRQLTDKMSLLQPSHSDSVFGLFGLGIEKTNTVSIEKPVLMDSVRQGRMIENLLLYQQTFVVRSYEVGADRTASIDTLMNLFQETALNHVRLAGIGGDGFGTTKAMVLHGLIWVVSRMHVEIDRYPSWGEVLEMDSWVASSGKNGLRRDWLLRNAKTGRILARATSTWVMMHQKTRRLSKMPDAVRAEISPFFLERHAIQDDVPLKINKLPEEEALYKSSNLQARRTDLDMNQHVNNVKYLRWMMESVPAHCLETLEIKSITLEYRRECGQADLVDSLTNPEQPASSFASTGKGLGGNGASIGEFPYLSRSTAGVTYVSAENRRSLICEPEQSSQFIHLLKKQTDGAEIVRGRTVWKSKPLSSPSPATFNQIQSDRFNPSKASSL